MPLAYAKEPIAIVVESCKLWHLRLIDRRQTQSLHQRSCDELASTTLRRRRNRPCCSKLLMRGSKLPVFSRPATSCSSQREPSTRREHRQRQRGRAPLTSSK